tara:strand:- start:4057 stop:4296 length:240 start_codon:yes stop_codon:yes gene_type:complete
MEQNRYYIIDSDDPNLNDIIAVSVGDSETQRYSIDRDMLVIKLHKGDNEQYPFLDQYSEYDHNDILVALNNSEWQTLVI